VSRAEVLGKLEIKSEFESEMVTQMHEAGVKICRRAASGGGV
jgi:Holliday junction resolvase